ncbi:MAG: UDP-glucose 4-epimerase GalE [Bacteroidota bacterium]
MKLLITGGAGYIGSHTIIALCEETDAEIVSVDNYSNSRPDTFDRIAAITGRQITNYAIDLTDATALETVFREHPDLDGIIHFAALKAVGESVAEPVRYFDNNINSVINLLRLCAQFDVPHFIFSSSCTVYGNIEELPVTENSKILRAESPYGFTKTVGERLLEDTAHSGAGLKAVSLRYFNPVGAHPSGLIGELPLGKPNNLVPLITRTAAGLMDHLEVFGNDYDTRDGTPIRDYIHVMDIARAHIRAFEFLAKQPEAGLFDVFNLGSGQGATVKEIIAAFESATGIALNYRMAPRRPGDVEAVYADSRKAREVLHWQPRYNLSDMMSSAWKWQQHLQEGEATA